MNILTFPRWKKTTTGVDSIQPATNGKEYQEEMKTCRLVITETANDGERVSRAVFLNLCEMKTCRLVIIETANDGERVFRAVFFNLCEIAAR